MNSPDLAPAPALLRNHADNLHRRRSEIAQAQAENGVACHDHALKSALGDVAAKRLLDRVIARGAELSAQAAALDRAIADADAEAARAAQTITCAQRAEKEAARQDLLQQRLDLAERIDSALRALLVQVETFSDLGSRIEQCHAALGHRTPILSPLAPETMGGRLAEFMAGLGFGAWLPLMRPEARAAIRVLREAEETAQRTFLQTISEVAA